MLCTIQEIDKNMRLTSQVLADAPIVINPEGNVTLQLRSLKIPYIENLAVTRDAYEVIDLTDNELVEVSNFPPLKNLTTLLLANNNIFRLVDEQLSRNLFNLSSISLVNNNISHFASVMGLMDMKNLKSIVLLNNPICKLQYYRLFLIWAIPSLEVLDFKKVKEAERKEAIRLFGDDKSNPKQLANQLLATASSSSSEISMNTKEERKLINVAGKLDDLQKILLMEKLKNASSLEEIEELENALKDGGF